MAPDSIARQCERLYMEAAGGRRDFEQALIRATFRAYEEADQNGERLFVPEEVPYSSGYLRRGIIDRKFDPVFVKYGGKRIPNFTGPHSRKSPETYHYSEFRLGPLSFIVNSSSGPFRAPRGADHRQRRLETLAMVLPNIVAEKKPDQDAPLAIQIKHGKDEVDSTVPQFLNMEVRDPDGVLVWRRDVFREQRRLVHGLLNVIEEKSQDDKGVSKLRRHLRRFDQNA